jgi:hypothetical protein
MLFSEMLYFVSRTLHTEDALMWDFLSNFQSQELREQSTRHFCSNIKLAYSDAWLFSDVWI